MRTAVPSTYAHPRGGHVPSQFKVRCVPLSAIGLSRTFEITDFIHNLHRVLEYRLRMGCVSQVSAAVSACAVLASGKRTAYVVGRLAYAWNDMGVFEVLPHLHFDRIVAS